ncbi:MAG: S1/P1 nuclease, partial [Candidatus Angelobacter sp.]
MNRIASLALIVVCVCGFQSRSYGWGCSGHEIIALIAERQLGPNAQQQVQALLGENALYAPDLSRFCVHTSLSAGLMPFYSTWADDFREQDEETAVWHFWNVPIQAATPPAASQFCNHGCVVQAIQKQVTLLKSNVSDTAKARALAFIIHLVGDLHQPLHVSTNNDRGGNCVPVTFFDKMPQPAARGSFIPNLHEIWDHDLPEKLGS